MTGTSARGRRRRLPDTWQTLWDRTLSETFGSPIGFVACAALALFGAKKVFVGGGELRRHRWQSTPCSPTFT